MRLLPPQRLRPHYYTGIEQSLRAVFADFLFTPLLRILAEGTTQADYANTAEVPSPDLLRAIRRGTLQYVDGVVTGDFNAATTNALRALGGEYDVRAQAVRLPEWAAPAWLRAEAAAARARAEQIHRKLLRELDAMQERVDEGRLPLPVDPGDTVTAIEEGFESAASALGIVKRIPPAQRAAIEARYAEDVRPHVVSATAKFIDGVHDAVVDNAVRGYRYETIVADLQHYVQLSERKAKFIARQETALLMAGYRQERFTEAGVTRYKWSTSHDIRVRPYADEQGLKPYGDHRALDKEIFTYAQKAPAQYMSRKLPSNPGEDYGCRCVDLAVLE